MSCNSNEMHEHKIWFVNSSSSGIHASCRDLFIPVEKIDKDSPGPAASIGVPFTYTLTIPVLFDPNGGIVVDDQGSQNDLHGVTVWDDLNATARRHDLREPHGSLAQQRPARAAHVHERQRLPDVRARQPRPSTSRPASSSSSRSRSCSRTRRPTRRARSSSTRRNGISAGSSRARSTSRCPASGASASR